MPTSPRHNSYDSHTVFLKPKANSASQPLILGSKQNDFQSTRRGPPEHAHAATSRAADYARRQAPNLQASPEREGDLLVRFGIDSLLGRVVARTLVWLILFQPVYVAMGMEIDEVAPTPPPAVEASAEESPDQSASESDADAPVEETVEDGVSETGADGTDETAATDDESADTENDVVNDVINDVEGETDATEGNAGTADATTDETDTDETTTDTTGDETTDTTDDTTTTDDDTATNDTTTDAPDDSTDDATSDGTTTDDGTDDTTADDGAEDTTTDNDETGDTTADTGGGGGTSGDSDQGTDAEDDVASTTDEYASSTDNHASSSDKFASSTEEHASTTDDSVTDEADAPLITAVNDESKYVFSDGDCTLVADGEFYCVAAGPTRQMSGDPRVYAEKDREGDREIFFFDGNDVQRITNNSYDDFAPVFEEETQRIVWQAMINDRLQVMLYELETSATRQITSSRQNSSNPDIVGDMVVWQEWIDTNWEIMLTDVNNNGQEFDIERLTDNAVHDMFPQSYEDLITWQSERGDSWEVIVYDLRTGKQTALQKDEGTKYENPRFVLLFDSKHENGDVETIGYDLDTGEMMELGTKSNPIPADPATPNDETPDAIPREATSTTVVKVSGRDDDVPDDDVTL